MPRRVFYSFHYQNDYWRVQQIRNIGMIEGNAIAYANEWEEIQRKGDWAIKNWINNNLIGKSCLVVLIGSETANRKYVLYEIERAWNEGKGVCGVHIHNLKDRYGLSASKGSNPFLKFRYDNQFFIPFSCPILDPVPEFNFRTGESSYYNSIVNQLPTLIENAIRYRHGKGNISQM